MAVVGMASVGHNCILLNDKCYFVEYLLSLKVHQKCSDLISLLGHTVLFLVAQVFKLFNLSEFL